jgi:hypothetical protein
MISSQLTALFLPCCSCHVPSAHFLVCSAVKLQMAGLQLHYPLQDPKSRAFYEQAAVAAASMGVVVDVYAAARGYIGLQTLEPLVNSTGGALYLYPSAEEATLPQDLSRCAGLNACLVCYHTCMLGLLACTPSVCIICHALIVGAREERGITSREMHYACSCAVANLFTIAVPQLHASRMQPHP